MEKLKIVLLDAPVDSWSNPLMQKLFNAMIAMKMQGYKDRFKGEHHVLPFDGSDFIGTHVMICLEDGEDLIPLLAYKSCSLKRCLKYNIPFTALSSVASASSSEHTKAVQELIDESQKNNLELTYDSSFTTSHYLNTRPELAIQVHSLFYAAVALRKKDYAIHRSIVLANLKFKTDITFRRMGGAPLERNGEELSSIECPYLGFSKLQIFLFDELDTEKTLFFVKKYQKLWDTRLVLSDMAEAELSLAA